MKAYATKFYKSKQWREVSKYYMSSKNYICERCGGVGEICHHRSYITPQNINNYDITLSMDNLECLCIDCHNQEHILKRNKVIFDDKGNVITVKDSEEIAEYKRAIKIIDKMKK